MGNLATPDSLIARWHEVLVDPSLKDLPYKIEINAWGKVEMSPASNRHGRLQAFISAEFARQLPGGIIITECSILTRIGIRVPDVVWGSESFMKDFGEITPYMQAPEICVEIISPSNVEAEIQAKTAAYLAVGAREVWIVSESGAIRIVGPAGDKARSGFPVRMTLPGASPKP